MENNKYSKNYYALSDTTKTILSLLSKLARTWRDPRQNDIKIKVEHSYLHRWGEELIITVENGMVSAETKYEYVEAGRLEDVIYYFAGADGADDIEKVTDITPEVEN